jgi:hypothetical protein
VSGRDIAEGCKKRRLSTTDARTQWERWVVVVVVDVVVPVGVFAVVAVAEEDHSGHGHDHDHDHDYDHELLRLYGRCRGREIRWHDL